MKGRNLCTVNIVFIATDAIIYCTILDICAIYGVNIGGLGDLLTKFILPAGYADTNEITRHCRQVKNDPTPVKGIERKTEIFIYCF